MNVPNLKDLVSNNKKVTFLRYQNQELWYRCEDGFEFPVHISDTGEAAFLPEDKALYFMRWIRKHLDFLKKSLKDEEAEMEEEDSRLGP